MDRFWSKVDKNGPVIYEELGSCWIWTAARNGPNGYGAFRIGKQKHDAHRVAYELQIGPIPEGLCVLHKCDNPPCVRGDHLFVGTRGDNNKDMHKKGRHPGVPVEILRKNAHRAADANRGRPQRDSVKRIISIGAKRYWASEKGRQDPRRSKGAPAGC